MDHPHPGDDGGAQSHKRRKVNTCLQCKGRKVKCDRVRPHCGPCQKRRIPADRCVWADEATNDSEQYYQQYQGNPATQGWNDSQFYDQTAGSSQNLASSAILGGLNENDAKAMLDRISRLEMKIRSGAAPNSFDDGQPGSHNIRGRLPGASGNGNQIDPLLLAGAITPAQGEPSEGVRGDPTGVRYAALGDRTDPTAAFVSGWKSSGLNGSNALDSEQNLAADALATIARNHPQAASATSQSAPQSVEASLSSSDGPLGPLPPILDQVCFPFSIQPSTERVKAVLGLLPNDHVVDVLLDSFREVDYSIMHGLSWRLVRIQLINLRGEIADWRSGQTQEPDVDLSFLALLFSLMVSAVGYMETDQIIEEGIVPTPEKVPEVLHRWHATMQALLAMIDFMNQPNLNVIQALMLSRLYLASQGQGVPYLTILSICIRLCQALGFHRLGSARDDTKRWLSTPEALDPDLRTGPVTAVPKSRFKNGEAFGVAAETRLLKAIGSTELESSGFSLPHRQISDLGTTLPDRSHLVREAARRLWYHILIQDFFSSASQGNTFHISPNQYDTKPPANIDEIELPDGESPLLPSEKEPGRPTESSLVPFWYQCALATFKGSDVPAVGHKSYDTVMEEDRMFRKLLEDLPVYLKLDGVSENLEHVKEEEAAKPYLATQRLVTTQGVNNRLLLIHRGYMGKGHYDPKYAESTKMSVEAARMVLHCRSEIQKSVNWAIQNHFPFRVHVFNACLILVMHLLELARKGVPQTEEHSAIREEIKEGLAFLSLPNSHDNAATLQGDRSRSASGKKMIEALLLEESNRRAKAGQAQAFPGSKEMDPNASPANPEIQSNGGSGADPTNLNGPEACHNQVQLDELPDPYSAVSPDDPINVYLAELLNTSENVAEAPPTYGFFDVLDGFIGEYI
ncbi:hypothetical protein IE53DRAFT_145387 [Violaceomyces palustris]|uniref:Uncharacterized protein n=1 Tax=Violaceomyces palustris TaxID=1673888 RepID=A0ACD0P6E6_9BASI|nr:hypothetical protein IE53DRAFT_145387 [Violaceomyces palustris]